MSYDYSAKRARVVADKGIQSGLTFYKLYSQKREYAIRTGQYASCKRSYLGEEMPAPELPRLAVRPTRAPHALQRDMMAYGRISMLHRGPEWLLAPRTSQPLAEADLEDGAAEAAAPLLRKELTHFAHRAGLDSILLVQTRPEDGSTSPWAGPGGWAPNPLPARLGRPAAPPQWRSQCRNCTGMWTRRSGTR